MAVTKFAQNGLVRLGYEINGEGEPVVVLLHGLLQDRVTMRPLADALQDSARVISLDLRGHGGSSAIHGVDLAIADLDADVLAVLDAAEITAPAMLVGVELGSAIAQSLQANHPDRIAGIVHIKAFTPEMLDSEKLEDIATRAYREQAEQALGMWLDMSWGADWREVVPKPRIASARRSAGAIHPILTALTRTEVAPVESLQLPGGTPFAEPEDVERVLAEVMPLLSSK